MIAYTVLDIEAKVEFKEDGRIDGSPYNPTNYLVSVGYKMWSDPQNDTLPCERYLLFSHRELNDPKEAEVNKIRLQFVLDNTDVLIGHNIKFDLCWLLECGFKYDGILYDTMICEHILSRGVKRPFNLEESCKRRNVQLKKSELVKDYWNKGIGYEAMPIALVEEYGRGDVQSTYELYHAQQKLLQEDKNKGLIPTITMACEFTQVLVQMERNGIYINTNALDCVERDYLAEKAALSKDIHHIVADVMGDTNINLASPEQVSWVIYSRRVVDKHKWVATFNIGPDARGKPKKRPFMDTKTLIKEIRNNTEILHKTRAEQCNICGGTGHVDKFTKKGEAYKNIPRCPTCSGIGIRYINLSHMAGLGLGPRNIQDLTAGGFATDKETLLYLSQLPQISAKAKELLTKMVRLNAVETYLSNFVGGIRRSARANKILHTSYNQCVTDTARLSSSDPNFQNQPRGKTFPIKRVVRSRWRGGLIAEIDKAQLEFRVAQELSGCHDMLLDICDPSFDAHRFTSKTLTDAGEPTNRQDAKPHTFKPLYGGMSGTPAQVTYYKSFMDKYNGLRAWHDELLNTALRGNFIKLPSGREFHFPGIERTKSGYVVGSTRIKNYPVQSFATADLVPIACIKLHKLMKEHKVKSLMINTVHDSIVCDIFPGELELMAQLMIDACMAVYDECKRRYNYALKVPLGVELKVGHNWLSLKEYKVYDLAKRDRVA